MRSSFALQITSAQTSVSARSNGKIGDWSGAEFASTLRTGERPDGTALSPGMPWQSTAAMTEVELEALYLFFNSLE